MAGSLGGVDSDRFRTGLLIPGEHQLACWSMDPELVVVIVTHNSSHVVDDLLDSIPEAVEGIRTHVIVVDNGSTDATAAIVAARADCELICSQNGGYAAGINKGIHASPRSSAILILNPDVRLYPGSAKAMVAALDVRGRGLVVPRVLDAVGNLSLSLRREPTLLRSLGLGRLKLPLLSEYCTADSDYVMPHAVDWALGAVVVMSRACYDTVGIWDESYFLYSEETDFFLRARDLGFIAWFEPAAVAMHIGKQSGYDEFSHSMLVVNRVRLYRRRHGPISSWLYFSLTLLCEATWMLRGQRESRAAIVSLLRPSQRPSQLGDDRSVMPS